jgi:hypothetical protein
MKARILGYLLVVSGTLFFSVAVFGLPGNWVDWSATGGDYLYDASGAQLTQDGLLIQLIVDDNGDTDFSMLTSGYVGVGDSNSTWRYDGVGGAAVHSSAEDDVAFEPTNAWTWISQPYEFHYVPHGRTDTYGYFSKPFYFRWFNATTISSATQAGIIYQSGPTGYDDWITPFHPVFDFPTAVDFTFGRSGVGGTIYDPGNPSFASITSGTNAGWQSNKPVPEPTTIVLIGFGILGLLGVVIRQHRKKK